MTKHPYDSSNLLKYITFPHLYTKNMVMQENP